ncbi:AAA family ATPase [Streptomyces griseocarneus]|nr:AAA family ATPase [Streptomyces griseocarneus]
MITTCSTARSGGPGVSGEKAVLGAFDDRRSVKKAERAWNQGVALWGRDDPEGAATFFEEAVAYDPTAADAWLGLHATGRREEEAFDALVEHVDSLGALREKFGVELSSWFSIGDYVQAQLVATDDLWLATVAGMLRDEEYAEAAEALDRAPFENDSVQFLRARLAVCVKEWDDALSWTGALQQGSPLADEADLYAATALVCTSRFAEALDVLAPLPRYSSLDAFEADVAALRGAAHQGLGDPDEALKHYRHALRLDPELDDVAEAVQELSGEPEAVPGTGHPRAQGSADGGPLTAEARAALLAEAQRALDAMIGLEPVKHQVRTLIAQLRMAALREEQGLPAATRPRHFVFSGPPGTGKTTVARIIGKVFAGLGLLSRGHVVEAQRVDLVGQYLGATAIKTTEVIDSALDGVLFIDEAYALANTGHDGGDAFGTEAVQVLLKRAEDDRDRLVVVLAGYRKEMSDLLATNPGLASRFTTRVDFPSYSAEELVLIAESLVAQQGDTVSPDGRTTLAECFTEALGHGLGETLGNGRFARELCQKASAARDLRLATALETGRTPTREEITTLLAEDVAAAYEELVEPHVNEAGV